jgi:hypothetical protein
MCLAFLLRRTMALNYVDVKTFWTVPNPVSLTSKRIFHRNYCVVGCDTSQRQCRQVYGEKIPLLAINRNSVLYQNKPSIFWRSCKKVKVKDSRNKPDVAQRVPVGLGSQISTTFGKWWWWGQPHAPTAFTHGKFSWYSCSLGAELTPRP